MAKKLRTVSFTVTKAADSSARSAATTITLGTRETLVSLQLVPLLGAASCDLYVHKLDATGWTYAPDSSYIGVISFAAPGDLGWSPSDDYHVDTEEGISFAINNIDAGSVTVRATMSTSRIGVA